MVAIFVESTVASQTAAAALLFSQIIDHGIGVAVQPEEMVSAALAVLTDLTQVQLEILFIQLVFDYQKIIKKNWTYFEMLFRFL